MRFWISATLLTIAVPAIAVAQTTPAPTVGTSTATASTAKLTTEDTDIATLLANPSAKAVLAKHIPAIVGNEQITMAGSMTLRALQSYSPDLTDDILAKIDVDLAKIPAK